MNPYLIRTAGRIALGVAAVLVSAATAWSQEAACGQPLSEGDTPTIRDCIYIARASIGAVPCGDCVCDTNGSGDVRITDALHCLWFVVGGDVTLDCPPCASTTTTMPTCASCNDVRLGLAQEEDLCETSRLLYETMVECPCGECGDECPRLCVRIPDENEEAPPSFSTCWTCLHDVCGQAIAACVEN